MIYQSNCWYVIAVESEITRSLVRRTILSQPILLFRQTNGTPVALFDRCPHRFAPLSQGSLHGDVIECRYHGLRFDNLGACIFNPHGQRSLPGLAVRHYPLVERYGWVWIWMGDSRLADPAKIPDLSYIDEVDQWRTVYINMPVDFRHDILVDNLLDISHADYLHHGSFSGGPPKSGFTEVFEEENSVLIVRRQQDCPPLVGYGHLGRTDLEIRTRWHPGHVLTFEVHVLPINSGSEPTIIRFAQAITPETERTTHYFMAHSRDQDLENPALDRKMVEEQTAFILAEDVPMLRAVDTEMAGKDLLSMRPVVLPVDKGALLVRRKLKKLINEELPRK